MFKLLVTVCVENNYKGGCAISMIELSFESRVAANVAYNQIHAVGKHQVIKLYGNEGVDERLERTRNAV